MKKDKVSIIMGSQSDWKTLQLAENILNDFKISNEVKIFQLIELQRDCIDMLKMLIKTILKL